MISKLRSQSTGKIGAQAAAGRRLGSLRRSAIAGVFLLSGCYGFDEIHQITHDVTVVQDGSLEMQLTVTGRLAEDATRADLRAFGMMAGAQEIGDYFLDAQVVEIGAAAVELRLSAEVPGNIAVGFETENLVQIGREARLPDVWRLIVREAPVRRQYGHPLSLEFRHQVCVTAQEPWVVTAWHDPDGAFVAAGPGRHCATWDRYQDRPAIELVVTRGDTRAWPLAAAGLTPDFPSLERPVSIDGINARDACLESLAADCIDELLAAELERVASLQPHARVNLAWASGRNAVLAGRLHEAEMIRAGLPAGIPWVSLSMEMIARYRSDGREEDARRLHEEVIERIKGVHDGNLQGAMIINAASEISKQSLGHHVQSYLDLFDRTYPESQLNNLAVELARRFKFDEAHAMAKGHEGWLRVSAQQALTLFNSDEREEAVALIDDVARQARVFSSEHARQQVAVALVNMDRHDYAILVRDEMDAGSWHRQQATTEIILALARQGKLEAYEREADSYVEELRDAEAQQSRDGAAFGLIRGLADLGDITSADDLLRRLEDRLMPTTIELIQVQIIRAELRNGNFAAAGRRASQLYSPTSSASALSEIQHALSIRSN